jgi:hypothetical protein
MTILDILVVLQLADIATTHRMTMNPWHRILTALALFWSTVIGGILWLLW